MVLGAGPAGLATAVALQAAGLPVVVLERRAAGENTGTALGLWTNAWQALDALGAAAQLRQQHPAIDRWALLTEGWCAVDNGPSSVATAAFLTHVQLARTIFHSSLHAHSSACSRIELCRDDGRLLRGFSLNQDCEGGPHEFRGVQRASLLRALEARLEPDTGMLWAHATALMLSLSLDSGSLSLSL